MGKFVGFVFESDKRDIWSLSMYKNAEVALCCHAFHLVASSQVKLKDQLATVPGFFLFQIRIC